MTLTHNSEELILTQSPTNNLHQWFSQSAGRLKAMRRGLIEGGFESTAVKSGAINQLEALLSKLLFVLQTRGLGYRCILTRHFSESCICTAVYIVQ